MTESSTSGSDRYEEDVEPCQECGEDIDFTEADAYWKTADDRFWHDDCHDPTEKLDRVEEIREELLAQIVGEDCFDGLSDDFHNHLDQIQVELDDAVRRERLRQDQELVTDGGTAVEGRTRVGHCKQDETDVYAGRGPDGRNMLGSRVGQRGWLGNPHRVEENGRELSIEKFRIDFEQKLARDPTFAAAIADLSGKTLGCWCQRLDEDEPACHAEIIAEHADRLARELNTVSERGGGGA